MDALPYYKWHWRDYRANRRVQRMPWQAKGLYRELLDEFWAEGSLPMEHDELADICGCTTEEFAQWWPHIIGAWEERDGRLFNRKMDEQRTAQDRGRVAMSAGGRAGGKASNSSTRAKAEPTNHEGTPAHDKPSEGCAKPTLSHPQAMPDIAEHEQSRAEHKQEQRTFAQTSQGESALEPSPKSPTLGTIPCNGDPKLFAFTEADVGEWQASFPGVDVLQQLRQCRQWNIDNPQKRKTARGMRRFINAWLSREQDRSGKPSEPARTMGKIMPNPLEQQRERIKAYQEQGV